MGSALDTIFDSGVEIHSSDKGRSAPGLDWHLSDEAKQTIDEIESNIRAAEHMSGRLLAG